MASMHPLIMLAMKSSQNVNETEKETDNNNKNKNERPTNDFHCMHGARTHY
jgi:hypothetical protein